MCTHEDTSVRLPDGYEAYARFWPVPSPRGAVLYLHGIQSHCGWYAGSARRIQQAGYAVLQPDRRGSGRNRVHRGHADSCRQLVEDARCCGEALCRRSGQPSYHVVGISWGGKLACALAMSEPRAVGLSLICPGLFPKVGVGSGDKIRIGLSMMASPRRLHDIPLNDPQLFTDAPRWIEFLRNDDLRLQQVSAAFFLASRRMDRGLRQFSSAPPRPLQVFLAGHDAIIDAELTARWARALNWQTVRILHYSNSRHTLEFDQAFETYCEDLLHGIAAPDCAV